MAKVGCCILCPSGFAAQQPTAATGCYQTRSPALLDVAGTSVLQHWFNAVQKCPQLNNVTLYIVCNLAEQAQHEAYLAQHQQQHTLCGHSLVIAQLGSSAAPNHIAGLTALAAAQPLPDLLIVLDGACLCEPGFSLQRFVQHSLTRNADMITFSPTVSASNADSHMSWAQLQDSSINPRVTAITQQCSPDVSCIVGPVYGLTKATCTAVIQQAGMMRLQDAMQQGLQMTALYGSPIQCSFDLSSLEGYLYADAFFTFCQQQWALLHGPTITANAPLSPAQQQQQGKNTYQHAQQGGAGLEAGPSDVQAALDEFNSTYAAAMTEEAYKRFLAGRSTAIGGSRLPERFADAALWRWRRKYEHPVYMTSNNDYGAKPPSQPMMPLSWHGVKGEFTKNYIKAEIRTGNFTTGMPSSRVHDMLTELC